MSLAVVRDLREARAPAGPDELAAFETDVLAGFVLARAAAGLSDNTIRSDVLHLPLYGSCRPGHQTAGTVFTQAQWAKNRGLMVTALVQASCAFFRPRSRLCSCEPAHQVGVDARQEGIQRRAVEGAVALPPASHPGVDPGCEVRFGDFRIPVQPPGPRLPADLLQGVAADGRVDPVDRLPVLGRTSRPRNVYPRKVNAVCS